MNVRVPGEKIQSPMPRGLARCSAHLAWAASMVLISSQLVDSIRKVYEFWPSDAECMNKSHWECQLQYCAGQSHGQHRALKSYYVYSC